MDGSVMPSRYSTRIKSVVGVYAMASPHALFNGKPAVCMSNFLFMFGVYGIERVYLNRVCVSLCVCARTSDREGMRERVCE